nr:MAG TPA: Protein of unknown function (DUF1351) [Caudoviricetes sp.]
METLEFVMQTDLSTALPAVLEFNYDTLKSALAARMDLYRGLVVTEDGIKAAKQDRADLNKLREAIDAKRKEVKKACLAPYNNFEARVKELTALVDAPIAAIDKQLQQYEEQRRATKRADVQAIYEETVGELRSLLPFDKLWRDEWYNTSWSMKKIREAIVAAEGKAASDLEVLSTVESEFIEAVKLKYLEALDLNAALAERARLQERAAKLRQYEEQQRQAQENTTDNLQEEERAKASARGAEQAAAATQSEGTEENIYLLRFECQLTRAQAAALADFLKSNRISYRRI